MKKKSKPNATKKPRASRQTLKAPWQSSTSGGSKNRSKTKVKSSKKGGNVRSEGKREMMT